MHHTELQTAYYECIHTNCAAKEEGPKASASNNGSYLYHGNSQTHTDSSLCSDLHGLLRHLILIRILVLCDKGGIGTPLTVWCGGQPSGGPPLAALKQRRLAATLVR